MSPKVTKNSVSRAKATASLGTPPEPAAREFEPSRDASLNDYLARMDRVVKEACRTPQGAKALLIRAGILTKKGEIRKKYRL